MLATCTRTASCHRPRPRALVAAGALAVALALGALPARAEIQWASGARSAPAAMQPAELQRSLGTLAARPAERHVVIHFDGPLALDRRAALEARGLRVLNYLGGHAYFAVLAASADPSGIALVPGTVAVEPIDPLNKLHPDLAAGIVHPWSVVPASTTAAPAAESPAVAVYVLFHRDFALDRAAAVLAGFGAAEWSQMRAINGVVAHLPMDQVAALAAHDDVMWVEPPLPKLETFNDDNRARTGANTVQMPPYNLNGSGVTVMVYDGGKVANHADLAGRLTIGQSDTGFVIDHATHVACTIAGNDNGGPFSGMAPAASIVSYTFEMEGGLGEGFLYTEPGDLEADYTEAITLYGADLANNSIGSNVASNGFPCSWEGNYGATGALIDEVARGSVGAPFRIVWANGNERGPGTCGTSYATTPPPACAKNHMTVGALNSNDDSVTSFTSWGPCDDGRLKPDVSAPGCQSSGDGGVTSCVASGGYGVSCGTSMASPTAAGLAALVLQQYRQSFPARPDPRNATLRAIFAQTAVDLGNTGPDYQTGYGSIRAKPAVDLVKAERFVEDTVSQGEVYTFSMDVTSGSEVKVTLAWDDPAGTPDVNPILVNDLDLRIIGPTSTVHLPWTLNPANPGAAAVQTVRDGVNNIEQVRIAGAPAGTYTVEIVGFDIAEGPSQSFGVATSHEPVFCAEAPTFGGAATVTAGDSCGEIDLTWTAGQSNCTPPGNITYNVYRGTNVFFAPQASNRIAQGLTGTSMTDVGLVPGTLYYYIVRADDSASHEDPNFIKKSAVPPASPDTSAPSFAGLSSASAGPECGEVLLSWPAALETCSAPVRYDIHRSTAPGFIPGPSTLVATTFGTSFVDTSVPPGVEHSYLVRATDASGNQDSNLGDVAVTPTAFDVEFFKTEFEPNNAGWALGTPNDATTGNWQWGNPTGSQYQPEDDATPGAGVNCWITGLAVGGDNGDVDGGTTTLLSSAYDLTGAVNPSIAYSRWFTNDQGGAPGEPTDAFHIDVSNNNGVSWSQLELIGPGTPLAWVPVELPLPISPTAAVRVRFTAADLGAGSLVEAGIDDFSLIDAGQGCLQCTVPPPQTLCDLSVSLSGDDVIVDWSVNPVAGRAVVYHVTGCGAQDRVKLGTVTGNFFVHEGAAASADPFNYRVTFVDDCGNEQPFCGPTDCP